MGGGEIGDGTAAREEEEEGEGVVFNNLDLLAFLP